MNDPCLAASRFRMNARAIPLSNIPDTNLLHLPMTNNFQRSFIASALSLLAACSTTASVDATPPTPVRQPAPDAVRAVAADQSGLLSKEDLAALRDPANLLSKRSLYFDLDSSVIKQEYRQVVETHGKFLSGKSGVKITVRGNTDERGSREYNLALGQRRADVVKQALQTQGVRDDQIDAVSFGSEKPVAEGHSESAWAKNRRVDIAYPGE